MSVWASPAAQQRSHLLWSMRYTYRPSCPCGGTFLKILMSCEAKLLSSAIVFATSFTKLGIPELLRKVLSVPIWHIKLPFYINNRITNKQSKHNFSWVLEKPLFNLMSTLIYNRVLNSYTKLRSDNKIKNLIQLQSYTFLFKTVCNNL